MKRLLSTGLAALAVLACHTPAVGEDIDLFVQPAGVAAGLPNVLIVLDNTANWNTAFTNEIAALVSTVNGLAVNGDNSAKFRVGLMLFTETGVGTGNTNIDGGYVRAAMRNMTGGVSGNKAKYMALLNSLDVLKDKSNGGKAGKTMSEVYQYYSALAPISGNGKVKTDYTSNVVTTSAPLTAAGVTASNAIYLLSGNALPRGPGSTPLAGTPYNSPLVTGSCAGNYVIYISNGAVQDNTSDNTTATNQLTTAANAAGITGATTAIAISPSGSASNVADEWARFMKKSSKAITTYTLDVDKITTGQGPGWTALLKSMAGVSGGKYFDVSSGNGGSQVSIALGKIFSEIQAVNSVFASVSLPVSVNTEGTYLNQVYIGMFRPDADALPRWSGNLKQYKLAKVGSQLKTVDADGSQAINPGTGFITECARSFWTPSTADAYWTFRPQGGCTIGTTNYDNSNYPDGKVVEKGAQAYVLRSTTTRTLKTCSSVFASCTTLLDFNNTNVSQTDLGAASTAERDALINWDKGQDVDDEDIDAVTTAEMRPSAHGDVVHSRPIAIDFRANPAIDPAKVIVFYGGNDGVLRAINGNRTVSIGGVAAGKEMWAFTPPEFHAQVKRLRDNSTQINFQGNPTTSPTPLPKPYGVDGAIANYNNSWLYVGMRRGGRVLYAFDISGFALSSPTAPTLKWKVGCPNQGNDTGCSTGFTDLGQTWSAPKIMKVGGYKTGGAGTEKPIVIMGGGYDTCEDADVPDGTCKSSGKGNGVYLLDANTGSTNTLPYFPTDRPVVGDVFVVTDSVTGLAKWAYAADLGGNIYRISGGSANLPFNTTPPTGWNITKIASLGCPTQATCASNRKFMFMPDIVEKDDTYYLLLGSGDREKPLDAWPDTYAKTNYFFMVKDKPEEANWLNGTCDTGSAKVICLTSLTGITTSADPSATDLAASKGWYLGLNANEQVVTSAITVFGNVTFSTHTPAVPVLGSCTSNLGTARVYNVRYLNASPKAGSNNRNAVVSGGGLPPSPVAGKVTLDDGVTYPFVIGADPASSLESSLPTAPSTGTQPKSLTYWYIEK